MIQLALTLAFLPVLDAPHAHLHDGAADVYVACPDVPAAVGALADAPMARVLAEPAVQGLVRGLLGKPEGVDVTAEVLFEPVWSMLPIPDESTDSVRALASSIGSLAWSFHAPRPGDAKPAAGFLLTVDFASAEAAASAAELLRSLGDPLGDGVSRTAALLLRPGDAPVDGVRHDFHVAAIDELFGQDVPLWTWSHEAWLVFGGGDVTPESVAAVATGGRQAIGAQADFARGTATLGAPEGTTLVEFFQTRGPGELLEALGLGEAERASMGTAFEILGGLSEIPGGFFDGVQRWRMQRVEDRVVTEFFFPRAASATPGVFWNRPIDPSWTDPVPGRVMAFYSAAIDGDELGRWFRELAASSDDPADAAELAAFEASLGFPLERLFGQLGPGMIGWAMPLAGLAVPKSYVWVDLDDPAMFEADMAVFCEQLGEHLEGWRTRSRPYRLKLPDTGERIKIPVTTVYVPGLEADLGGMPISVQPTFAVHEGRLLAGLTPMGVKRELKRLVVGSDEEALPHPAVTHDFTVPGDALSVLFLDWGALVEGLLRLAKTFGGLAQGMGGGDMLPFDLSSLPPPEVFTAHVRPTWRVSRAVDGGTYTRHEASYGPETWLGLAGLVVQTIEAMEASSGVGETVVEASTPVAPEEDPVVARRASESALETVAVALTVYRIDHGRFPGSLAKLGEPTESYPNGFLNGDPLPADGWGCALHYSAAEDGSSYRLWSSGANGANETGAGDDVLRSFPH